MLPTFIITKNFPLLKQPIKKPKPSKKSLVSTKAKTHLPSTNLQMICQPEKCLRMVSHYNFTGGIVVLDHLTVSEQNDYMGYFKMVNETKKITSLAVNSEFKMLEINMEDKSLGETPFKFFEERMKSLGDREPLEFCETLEKILNYFQKAVEKPLEIKGRRNQEINNFEFSENYNEFKMIIRKKLENLTRNNDFFIIIFIKSDQSNPQRIQSCQHYISETLLEKIYLEDKDYLFDIMRNGIPDFYGFDSNYYSNITNLFKRIYLNEPIQQQVEIVIKDNNENISKGVAELETFNFQTKSYQEYVIIQKFVFKDQNPTSSVNPMKNEIPIEGKYDDYAQEFRNKFYPIHVPLNQMIENQGKVCGYKIIG